MLFRTAFRKALLLKKTKSLIQSGRYLVKDKLLLWSLSNLRVKVDANGNVYPNKAKAVDKFDPVLATIQAYWLYNKLTETETWAGL